jgi:hypothetical protein
MICRKFNFREGLEEQRELYLDCFPENANNSEKEIEHYMWKFHSPGREGFEYGAYLNNDLIGYYAALPYNYNFKNELIKAAMVCDVMTGTKARGKGVFTNLGIYATGQLAEAGFDFTTGYPVRKEVIPGHLKAGWAALFDIPIYSRVVSLKSLLEKVKLSYFELPLQGIWNAWVYLLGIIFYKKIEGLVIEEYAQAHLRSIDGFEEYIENSSRNIPIYLNKSIEFLEWRLGAPQKHYNIFIVRSTDEIVGHLISCNTILKGFPATCILDLFVNENKDTHKYVKYLLDNLVRHANKHRSVLLAVMIRSYWAKKYKLYANGFIKTPIKFTFILKQLKKSRIAFEVLKNPESWNLMWIDSDDL